MIAQQTRTSPFWILIATLAFSFCVTTAFGATFVNLSKYNTIDYDYHYALDPNELGHRTWHHSIGSLPPGTQITIDHDSGLLINTATITFTNSTATVYGKAKADVPAGAYVCCNSTSKTKKGKVTCMIQQDPSYQCSWAGSSN